MSALIGEKPWNALLVRSLVWILAALGFCAGVLLVFLIAALGGTAG